MIAFEKMTDGRIRACARLYVQAYAQEPWKESWAVPEVEVYLRRLMEKPSFPCYVLLEEEAPVALAVCILIPYIQGGDTLRIEDFCVAPHCQRRGLGSTFLEFLRGEARRLGADCLMLGTQRDYPSHRFYQKNGFTEVESAVLLYRGVDGRKEAPDSGEISGAANHL